MKPLYLYLRNSYVDLLSRWNLLITRAKVEKYFPFGSDQQRIATSSSFDFGSNQAARCVLCRLPVRGINSVCPACGHGGHISHMKRWFEVICHNHVLIIAILTYSVNICSNMKSVQLVVDVNVEEAIVMKSI